MGNITKYTIITSVTRRSCMTLIIKYCETQHVPIRKPETVSI